MLSFCEYEKTIVALLAAGEYAGADEMFREVAALLAVGMGKEGLPLFMSIYNDCIAQAQDKVNAAGEKKNIRNELKSYEALSGEKKIITNIRSH